jgi:hypothetical protein
VPLAVFEQGDQAGRVWLRPALTAFPPLERQRGVPEKLRGAERQRAPADAAHAPGEIDLQRWRLGLVDGPLACRERRGEGPEVRLAQEPPQPRQRDRHQAYRDRRDVEQLA